MVQSREGLQMTTSLLLISKLPPVHTNLEINDHSLGSVLQETMLSPPPPPQRRLASRARHGSLMEAVEAK